jgi:hypothetical protein
MIGVATLIWKPETQEARPQDLRSIRKSVELRSDGHKGLGGTYFPKPKEGFYEEIGLRADGS